MVDYDALILGSGQGGNPLAHALAAAGQKVALIEREHVGGCCINEGCSPTKTMVASGRVAYLTRRAAEYGVHTGPIKVDLRRVRDRKQAIVDSFRSGSQRRLEETPNIDLIFGEAAFSASHAITIQLADNSSKQISAERIFINTGCMPAPLKLPGSDSVPTVNSTSIMELERAPDHLLVVGAGYISLEFAQMFRRFGSRVTILVRGDCLLTREDTDISSTLTEILREDGLEILFETEIASLAPSSQGLTATLKSGDKIEASVLLAAIGRLPTTDRLNLKAAGVETGQRGYVKVNERLETNVQGIYALGDVKGGPAFTHISYDDYRILKANLLDGGNLTTRDRQVPYTLFTDPQLGRVGITEAQAKKAGLNARVATMPMNYVARALEVDESRGMLKAVVGEDDQILGFAALGIEGGELMSVVETAMIARLPYTKLRDATWAHPTLAECLNTLFARIT